jgi:FKBP-type peptidyl-prolyl cis-trans isomerase 2
MIKDGSQVSFEYTISDERGNVLDSNKGEQPVTYTQGQQEIISGLEQGLADMNIDEEKSIRLEPKDAYGPINPQGFKEVPKADVPAAGRKVGALLGARGARGEDVVIRVSEVKDDSVVLDFNHPLAGKILNFDIKLVAIQPPGES